MTKQPSELADLSALIKTFCDERDWDQFHSAKDIAIGMVTESSELLELFRFKTEEQSQDVIVSKREAVGDELADVLYWVLRFAQKYDFDLPAIFRGKMAKNSVKYPVDKARGVNKKYTDF